MRRRTYLRLTGGIAATGLLAGCSGDGDSGGGSNEVAVGPENSLTFEPESLTVATGDTVTWTFESSSHNVSCVPEHNEMVSLPEGADSFASYEGDNRFQTEPEGETFTHTFEVAGTYDYVCVPHASAGMTGQITVEE